MKTEAELFGERCRVAYERRRKWSRTDTARWLNERSATVLAWLRRCPGEWPAHSRQVGYWVKEHAPAYFDRAHGRLAELDEEAREQVLLGELFA